MPQANPLTNDRCGGIISLWSAPFIKSWMRRFPVEGAKMRVADIPPEPLAPGAVSSIALERARVERALAQTGGDSAAAIDLLMRPTYA